ncbi:hypothetical protein PACTADRAFT_47996 [Pachysolen tannophilus NRRL Y-2460]|uniref:Uncharacterized protein n=1 Tax=Pachysolen tannophilus NRRL Y-2460 TaxID=669874 RepID=A0A1E4U2H5_PACTA|nr:hypothetical protein PACTADRAFT_47996 [Pachysolen tannophilus NRRL Y-2460]
MSQSVQFVLVAVYSVLKSVFYHSGNLAIKMIIEHQTISSVVLLVLGILIAIFVIKNLIIFIYKSVIQLIKLAVLTLFLFVAISVYFRGMAFFTNDLVKFYNLIVRDLNNVENDTARLVKNVNNLHWEGNDFQGDILNEDFFDYISSAGYFDNLREIGNYFAHAEF